MTIKDITIHVHISLPLLQFGVSTTYGQHSEILVGKVVLMSKWVAL